MSQPSLKEYFSTSEAALHAGLTAKMVDYLCRTRTVVPSGEATPGRGRQRRYIFGDLVILRGVAHLLRAGVSVAKLNRALALLRERSGEISTSSVPARFLVTDGQNIFLRSADQALVDLSGNGQLVFAFVIELEKLRREVVESFGGESYATA